MKHDTVSQFRMKGRALPLMSAAFGLMVCAAVQSAPAPSASAAPMVNEQRVAQITPGKSTKTQVRALLGSPWRVVQFNDCGKAMPGQSDETWDYRGRNTAGTFRVHIEFDDDGVAHLVAKIPDHLTENKGTTAEIAPAPPMTADMQM